MSFYNSPFTLYDFLDAFSNPNRGRDPQQQHRRRRAYRESFHPFYFGGPGYVYGIPGQDYYYYSPQYDYSEESDEKKEGNENEDNNMNDNDNDNENNNMNGNENENNEKENSNLNNQETQSKKEQPSYYHDTTGRRNNRNELDDQDYFGNLLSALFGVPIPSRHHSRRHKSKKGSKDVNLEKKEENLVNESKSVSEGMSQEGKNEESTTEESGSESRKSSIPLVSHESPNPGLEPLQVSKPEARLDLPFSPEVNVYDLGDRYIVVLALPGANSKAFKVDYHPSSHELIVRGNVSDKYGVQEEHLKITEIKYGAFERTVKFPILPRIEDDKIRATYSNGLLQVTVPKVEGGEKPAPKKRINIEDIPDEELMFEENPSST